MSLFRRFSLIRAHLVSQAKLPVPTAPVPAAPIMRGGFGKLFQMLRARIREPQKTASPMPIRTVIESAQPKMIVRGGAGWFGNLRFMNQVPRSAVPIFRTILQQKMSQGIPYYMARDAALREAIEKQKSAAQGQ